MNVSLKSSRRRGIQRRNGSFGTAVCFLLVLVAVIHSIRKILYQKDVKMATISTSLNTDSLAKTEKKPIGVLPGEETLDSLFGGGTYNKLDNPNWTYWSQYAQDRFIDNYLHQKMDGTFLEIGGYDGERFSNTLFFERSRGWKGLLVEANPVVFNIMKEKDRKCWMINACVSSTVSEMTLLIAGELTSAKELVSQEMKDRIKSAIPRYKERKDWAGAGEQMIVKCYTLQDMLAQTLQTTHIDYFSLDVEGAEMHLLQSFGFDQLSIDIFTIEMQENADDIRAFMKKNGYEEIKADLGVDSVFVRKELHHLTSSR